MEECRKRQVERRGDEVKHRCIHKKADTYRQHVSESVCASCPLRDYIEKSRESKVGKKAPKSLPIVDTSDYPSCEFRFAKVGQPICVVTNLGVDKEICRRCTKGEKMETASLKDKVINYSKALRKWVAAGRPERSDERVQQLFDEHCSKCSMFDKKKGVCNSCGCPSNTDQPAIRNKLKMATEHCPLGRFDREDRDV